MSGTKPEWVTWGYALTPLPELIATELRHNGYRGEYRISAKLPDGFYRIEIHPK